MQNVNIIRVYGEENATCSIFCKVTVIHLHLWKVMVTWYTLKIIIIHCTAFLFISGLLVTV